MGQGRNENLFPIHTPSIVHGALMAVSLVWLSCLRAMWAWWIVISIKYHQLWPRTRLCELTKVGTSKGHWPQRLLPISQLQNCTKSLPFFHLCTMDLFYRFFICKIVLKVFLSPMCPIISSSIVYGTTWTGKIQLQNSTTCHAINNVGCMHIFARLLRLLRYEKLRTFALLQRSQMGFTPSTVTMYLTLYDLSLEAAIASFGWKRRYQNQSM